MNDIKMDPVLNKLRESDTGTTGPTGPTGPAGGPTGPIGPTGPTGEMSKVTYDGANISQQLVGLTAAQILTNKSIDADNSTIINIGASEVKADIIEGQTLVTAPLQSDTIILARSAALKEISIGNLRQDINNDQTGASYTLALTDVGKSIWMNNASANTLTIPANAAVAFPVNSTILVVMEGAGITSITGDTGVTFNGISVGSGSIDGQYKAVLLTKRATNTWVGIGGIGLVS